MAFFEKYKHIAVEYYSYLKPVALMIKEHYDTPEYDGTIFMINTFWAVLDSQYIDEFYKYKRRIYYNLEHKCTDDLAYNQYKEFDMQFVDKILNEAGCTEFWTMDYNPEITYLIREISDIPIKYKPVRYTTLIPQVKNIYTAKKTIDFCHIGGLSSSHRMDLIRKFEALGCQISFKFITQTGDIKSCITNMNDSRFMLDTLRIDTIATPNQVRIFELLCMGYTVCTEKCGLNMFPGLVYEWETPEDLIEIANRNEYLHPTEAYKEMTYTDEAYGQYVNNLIKLQS